MLDGVDNHNAHSAGANITEQVLWVLSALAGAIPEPFLTKILAIVSAQQAAEFGQNKSQLIADADEATLETKAYINQTYQTLQQKGGMTNEEILRAVANSTLESGHASDILPPTSIPNPVPSLFGRNIPIQIPSEAWQAMAQNVVRDVLLQDPQSRQQLIDQYRLQAANAQSDEIELMRMRNLVRNPYDPDELEMAKWNLLDDINAKKEDAAFYTSQADQIEAQPYIPPGKTAQELYNEAFDQAIAASVNRALGIDVTKQEAGYDAAYLHAGPQGQAWINNKGRNPISQIQDDANEAMEIANKAKETANTVKSDLASVKSNLASVKSDLASSIHRVDALLPIILGLGSYGSADSVALNRPPGWKGTGPTED